MVISTAIADQPEGALSAGSCVYEARTAADSRGMESEAGGSAEREGLVGAESPPEHDVPFADEPSAGMGSLGGDRLLSREDVGNLVSKVPVFQRVAAEAPEFAMALADKCEEMSVAPGPIFARGDMGDEMYFIVAGVVAIHLELHIPACAELHPGDILGEGALLVNAARSAFAVAGDGTRLLRLSKDALEEVLPLYPTVAHEMAEVAMGRLARASSRLAGASLWTKPVPECPRSAEQLYTVDLAKGAITKSAAAASVSGADEPQFSSLAAAEQQQYQNRATEDLQRYRKETAAAGAKHAFHMLRYRDPAAVRAAAVCLVAPFIGVLPFLVPMKGDPRLCKLEHDNRTMEVNCATVEPAVFTFVVLPLWLLICTGFFLELMEPQFKHIGFDEEDAHEVVTAGGHPIGFAGSWKQKTLIIVGSQATCAMCLGVMVPAITGAKLGGESGTLEDPKGSWRDVMVYICVIFVSSWPVWWVIGRLLYRTSQAHSAHQKKKALAAESLKARAIPTVHHVPAIHGILDALHHHAAPPASNSEKNSLPGKNQNELECPHRVEAEAVDPILPPLARTRISRKHERRKNQSRCCAKTKERSAKATAGVAAEIFDAVPVHGNAAPGKSKNNRTRLEHDGVHSGLQFHRFLTQTRLQNWREESHHGSRAHKGMLRGFALWTLGLLLMIANWLWLIFFDAWFSAAVSTEAEIVAWSTLFDVVQFVAMQATVKVLKMGELERVGTQLTTFDRFHLVNIGKSPTWKGEIVRTVYDTHRPCRPCMSSHSLWLCLIVREVPLLLRRCSVQTAAPSQL